MHDEFNRTVGKTTAVILAAGLGSRLKHNTSELPKCLVPVAGVPMLDRMLASLNAVGVRSAIVVVGYLDEAIEQFLSDYRASASDPIAIRTVRNAHFARTGSVASLRLGLDQIAADQNVLMIEGDVVIDPVLLQQLLEALGTGSEAATLLSPYEPRLSGTFATVNNGLVTGWLHESVRQIDFDLESSFKTVNLTVVRHGSAAKSLLQQVTRTMQRHGPRAPLEYAMQQLVADGMRICAVPTRGLRWFEVDTPDDLDIANEMFLAGANA